ncbi:MULTISPECIES: GntR family transcriptional regulator [unclassified Devosia]|uniref:GntR family transcriptional regulator n=1 Tax=unclassified Devosia TaxID=196773 RepID=UPI0024A6F912|nr:MULTISPECIES: GntR family transcriptional regulator [unclassified Devosia]
MSSSPRTNLPEKRSNRSDRLGHAQAELILATFAAKLDRSLPVPLGVQLQGLIQYGIALGDLPAGMRLPSVRELAESAGVAPMTIVGVYNELKQQKLIESRGSSGTFVAKTESLPDPTVFQRLNPAIDALLQLGQSLGVDAGRITAMIAGRAGHLRFQQANGLNLVLVGLFADATQAYADHIRPNLPATDTLVAVTVDALRNGAPLPPADLILTFANRRAEVEQIVGTNIPVLGLQFIASEATRTRLAGLDPSMRVGIVSIFPQFMAMMKSGVMRFCPHVTSTAITMADDPELERFIEQVDVVVYATGLDWMAAKVAPHQQAFEYRHAPDRTFVQQHVLPLLDTLRNNTTAKETA